MSSPGERAERGLVAVAPARGVWPAPRRRSADELPLPGPAIDGPVLKRRRPAAPAGLTRAALGARPRRRRRCASPTTAAPTRRNTYVLPLPYVVYRGKLLRADRDGARAILFAGERVDVDVSVVGVGADAQPATTTRAQGMPDLAGTFEIGPNLNVELWQSHDKPD